MPSSHSWTLLASQLNLVGDVKATADELLRRYNEPHRKYHNVDHLTHALAELNECVGLTPREMSLIEVAIWFHDAVYDLASAHKEAESADLARTMLCAHKLPASEIELVCQMVLDTEEYLPTTSLSPFLLDADLAILGAQQPLYDRFMHRLQLEYASVPYRAWHAARCQFLRELVDREYIYFTKRARARYEVQARRNIIRELTKSRVTTGYYPAEA